MVSEALTNDFRVRVRAFYLSERSNPKKRQYVYAYRINITNEGEQPAKLISRHWVITDAYGRVDEVKGPGVVGEQPRLAPGESFEYTSTCPLPTQFGVMRGVYHMRADDGALFDVEISPFSLYVPALNN